MAREGTLTLNRHFDCRETLIFNAIKVAIDHGIETGTNNALKLVPNLASSMHYYRLGNAVAFIIRIALMEMFGRKHPREEVKKRVYSCLRLILREDRPEDSYLKWSV